MFGEAWRPEEGGGGEEEAVVEDTEALVAFLPIQINPSPEAINISTNTTIINTNTTSRGNKRSRCRGVTRHPPCYRPQGSHSPIPRFVKEGRVGFEALGARRTGRVWFVLSAFFPGEASESV